MQRLSQVRKQPRAQSGVASIEMAIVLLVMVTMLAGLVQISRAIWYYNAMSKASGDAARYLVAAPATELTGNARDIAQELIMAELSGAGMHDAARSVAVDFLCTPLGSAPCGGAAVPGRVTVRVRYWFIDDLFLPFSWTESADFSSLAMAAQTTMPH